jgi:hypothetical protein
MLRAKIKGQSTLEYVILLGFVVAALIAMGIYMKRGSQGQLRRATDQVGEQYEAGTTNSHYEQLTNIDQTETVGSPSLGIGHTQTNVKWDVREKSGNETVPELPAP